MTRGDLSIIFGRAGRAVLGSGVAVLAIGGAPRVFVVVKAAWLELAALHLGWVGIGFGAMILGIVLFMVAGL